ncbi:hypothetical protein ACLOJK_025619 [Asimina triloba]
MKRSSISHKSNGSIVFVLAIIFSVFLLFISFTHNKDIRSLAASAFASPRKTSGPQSIGRDEEEETITSVLDCDLYTGKWVFDNQSRPLYREEECEFNARLMLERLRGKRLMFVGDSLNRNQWESMMCLVQSVVPEGKKSMNRTGPLFVFRAEDYNATIEFYWAPFLVPSNADNPMSHSVLDRIIMADSISEHAKHWKDVDFLIFNTYMWWMRRLTMKVLRGSFDGGATEYDEIDRWAVYRRVLRTWATWVEGNVDPNLTRVFFNNMSPTHMRSTDWNNPDGIKCAFETTPIPSTTGHIDVGTDEDMVGTAARVTRSMKVPVTFLNITTLSEYRKDAHTSLSTAVQGQPLTPEQKSDPQTFADCVHWCLPGVPDTWNELLYAHIISR